MCYWAKGSSSSPWWRRQFSTSQCLATDRAANRHAYTESWGLRGTGGGHIWIWDLSSTISPWDCHLCAQPCQDHSAMLPLHPGLEQFMGGNWGPNTGSPNLHTSPDGGPEGWVSTFSRARTRKVLCGGSSKVLDVGQALSLTVWFWAKHLSCRALVVWPA